MIHQEGFVHADMHSGNLMARRVGKNSELILLDHGLYQQLDPALLHSYNQFWLGLILNDATLYDPAGRELGTTDPQMLRCILSSKNTE